MSYYKTGDLITFTYTSPTANDRHPIVLVVTPRWNGNMHGVNLRKLPDRERELLLKIVNPEYRSVYEGYLEKIPALRSILEKRQADTENMSPNTLYRKYISGFVNRFNSYRQYKPEYISGVRVLDYDKFRM